MPYKKDILFKKVHKPVNQIIRLTYYVNLGYLMQTVFQVIFPSKLSDKVQTQLVSKVLPTSTMITLN